jgi:hypothetical protein
VWVGRPTSKRDEADPVTLKQTALPGYLTSSPVTARPMIIR